MTIGTFACLIDPSIILNPGEQNGSVTVIEYENGKITIQTLGDLSYRQVGAKILEGQK